MMKTALIILLYNLFNNVCGSNILVMMPLPTYSHTVTYIPIFKELAKRGHNVTMVSPFPQKKPIPNYKDVVIENTLQKLLKSMGPDRDVRKSNFLINMFGLWPLCDVFLGPTFELPEFKEFLNDENSKFDLVILESFFCQQSLLAFGHKYKAPIITMTSGISIHISEVSGNSYPISYVPDMRTTFSDQMNFWERLINTLMSLSDILVSDFYGIPKMDNFMKKYFKPYPGFENLPNLSELQKNISLYMVDNHFSTSYPRPYLPNVVEFGGLSLKTGDELPKDLQKFMDDSKNGVIFFTWGSHYPMTNMKPELLSSFLSVFGKLKQRVLMKWENETLPGKPANVKIDKWFPQASILNHPNIRLFISHGGVHGVTEAVFNAVPLLGTPLFGDQKFNLKVAEHNGMALNVDVDTVEEAELLSKIKRLLEEPKFKENAVKRSLVIKDRPLSALDNAVYWVEYVLRHNGAHHLRAGSLDLTWYQNLLLDVIAFLVAVVVLSLILLVYFIKLLLKLFKKKEKPNKKEGKVQKKSNKSKKD